MSIVIRSITPMDIAAIVRQWNEALCYDPLDERQFRRIIFEDPNYEPEGTLIALDGTTIAGFIAAIARDGVQGKDGRGRPEEAGDGYIRAIFAVEGYAPDSALAPLLDRAEGYLRGKGKKRIRIVQYTGRYFFPGIDTRYQTLIQFLEGAGFQRASTIDDMDADLTDYTPNPYQRNAIQRAQSYGVQVVDYMPSMLPALRRFVERIQIPQWFSEGWEAYYKHMVVAFLGGEIIGWANYSPGTEYGSFGPIAVLPEHRGHGIGTWLLVESMLRVQRHGLPRIWASWTNTPFYVPNGWKICRQYLVFEKDIS